MNFVLGSLFRNAAGYLPAYFDRVAFLAADLAGSCHSFRLLAVEGDSTDRTRDMIMEQAQRRRLAVELATCNHGGPTYGSTEDLGRMIQLSKVVNTVFENVKQTDDVLIYVESDLHWESSVLSKLVELAVYQSGGYDIFAPFVMHANGTFYDVWGFRKNGKRFGHVPPYHEEYAEDLMEMDSVGSCLVMRAEIARACRIRNQNCLVGWCEDARAHGYRIATHPGLRITHP